MKHEEMIALMKSIEHNARVLRHAIETKTVPADENAPGVLAECCAQYLAFTALLVAAHLEGSCDCGNSPALDPSLN